MKFICKYLPLCISLVSFASNQTIDPRVEQAYVHYQIANAYMYDLVMPISTTKEEMAKRNDVIGKLSKKCLLIDRDGVIRSNYPYAQAISATFNDPSCILYTSLYDVEYAYLESKTHHDTYNLYEALSENERDQLESILKPIAVLYQGDTGYIIRDNDHPLRDKNNLHLYQRIYNTIEQVYQKLQEANLTYIKQEFVFILEALKEHMKKYEELLSGKAIESTFDPMIHKRLQFFISLCKPYLLQYRFESIRDAEFENDYKCKIISDNATYQDYIQLNWFLKSKRIYNSDLLEEFFMHDVIKPRLALY